MRHRWLGFGFLLVAVVAPIQTLRWLTLDVPIFLGWVQGTAATPDGPKDITVSVPAFIASSALSFGLLLAAGWLWIQLRRYEIALETV